MRPNQTHRLLHSKENHKQNEKTTYRIGEIFANDATEKHLISKIFKQVIQLTISKPKSSTEKWAQDFNRHFSKGDIQMAIGT